MQVRKFLVWIRMAQTQVFREIEKKAPNKRATASVILNVKVHHIMICLEGKSPLVAQLRIAKLYLNKSHDFWNSGDVWR